MNVDSDHSFPNPIGLGLGNQSFQKCNPYSGEGLLYVIYSFWKRTLKGRLICNWEENDSMILM
jgi:hypothetical protein